MTAIREEFNSDVAESDNAGKTAADQLTPVSIEGSKHSLWWWLGMGVILALVIGLVMLIGYKLGLGEMADRVGIVEKIIAPALTPTLNPTPTPAPIATVTGMVKGGYYQKPIANAQVSLTGEVKTYEGTTDTNGAYSIASVAYGSYTLKTTHAEYTFPPSNITVQAPTVTETEPISGRLTKPQATKINVASYADTNNNNQRESSEFSLPYPFSVSKKEGGKWVEKYSFSTTETSSYFFELTEMGEYQISALHKTFYTVSQPNQTIVVDGLGGNKDLNFGIQPTASERLLKVFVFDDQNENGQQDGGEGNVHYQAVEIRNNTTGNSYREAVPPEGTVGYANEFGNYTATLVPESESWANAFVITKGSVSFSIEAGANDDVTITLGAKKLY